MESRLYYSPIFKRRKWMKVFELAKELNVTPKELISFFRDNEYKISSHMQKLDDELIDFARNNFVKEEPLKEDVPEDNKSWSCYIFGSSKSL